MRKDARFLLIAVAGTTLWLSAGTARSGAT